MCILHVHLICKDIRLIIYQLLILIYNYRNIRFIQYGNKTECKNLNETILLLLFNLKKKKW